MANKIEKVVYQAHATATGGRDGSARSSDGLLDVIVVSPQNAIDWLRIGARSFPIARG